MTTSDQWELFDGTKVHGPFSEDALIKTIERGMPATMKARRVGEEKWLLVGAHEPFAAAVANAVSSGAGRVQPSPIVPPPIVIVKPVGESWTTGCAIILTVVVTAGLMGAFVYSCVL